MDSIVPITFKNLALNALNLIFSNIYGRLVALPHGQQEDVLMDAITGKKKVMGVETYYNGQRLPSPLRDFPGHAPLHHDKRMVGFFPRTQDDPGKCEAPIFEQQDLL